MPAEINTFIVPSSLWPLQAGPTSDAITHSLMTENRASSTPIAILHPYCSKQLHVSRGTVLPSGQGFTGSLSMIQDLIGEGRQVIIKQLVQSELTTEGSAPIQIPRTIHSRGNHPHPFHSPKDTDDHQRDFSRHAQEFIPVATQQRRADEPKTTQGKAINKRLTSLANYVILALLREKTPARRCSSFGRKARELTVSIPSEPTEPIQSPEPSSVPNDHAEILEPIGKPISPRPDHRRRKSSHVINTYQ